MEKSSNLIRSVIPSLIRNLSDWIQVDISVSIFGEKVLSFTWPPKKSNPKIVENEEIVC